MPTATSVGVDSNATTGAQDAASTATVEPARWPLKTASPASAVRVTASVGS